jgi:type IV pilus assembly protein PilC
MLLAVASLFTDLIYIPITFFMCIIALAIWMMKTDNGRRFKDHAILKIPVIKGIIEYAILERFCRILGAMVRAGVPLPDGMETTTEATANSVYRERLEVAREEMLRGSGFSGPLAATNLFPGAARQMFKVGEETGTLDEQLAAASEYFDSELEVRIKRFTTMFEPIMIIGVGLMVGFVAVALVSAMYGVLGGVKEGA